MDVDLVYLWVDGADPKWRAKYNAVAGIVEDNSETNCKGRYINNEELKYSLRSAEKYAPWIRKIFIVTDNQTPAWLDTSNPKIQIVDHRDILPEAALPCFNSNVIESFMNRIPGLSEYFLLANDDMFFNADVTPRYFFAKDGYPIIGLKRKPFGKWHFRIKMLRGKPPGQYRTAIHNASLLVEEKFGKYYSGLPHHNIDSYRKSDYSNAVEVVFKKEVENAIPHHIRAAGDLQRVAYSYYALAIGHGHMQYARRDEALRIPANKADFMSYLTTYNPKLFCLNDSQRVTDSDRERIKPFLEALFPDKSAFEK